MEKSENTHAYSFHFRIRRVYIKTEYCSENGFCAVLKLPAPHSKSDSETCFGFLKPKETKMGKTAANPRTFRP